ncbi:MAG: glycerophosphodiester phosphodiesterase [Pseudomonadales bacterium]|nr:glycerophosphodiester phosphodiesterase [Opitutaceae bacterium]MCC6297297.1 glycerophosphodiester phosphodiesterase [Pseudomonadales bacterium]
MRLSIILTSAGLLLHSANAVEHVVIAHRGASGYLPEHSLVAKAMAHAQGADFLEQDVVLTKDGVPIVLHDIHLETTTDVAAKFPSRHRADGRFYAIDFTLIEIKQLTATQRVDPKTRLPAYRQRFPINGYSYRIHSLEEEIRFIQGLNSSTGRAVGIYTEIKQPTFHQVEGQDITRIVCELLSRYGYGTRKGEACWIQCFEQTALRRLRTEFGWRGNLMMILGGKKKGADGTDYDFLSMPAGMREVAAFADAIGPGIDRVVTWDQQGKPYVSDFTRDAHAAGLQVHWGVVRVDDLPENCPSLDSLHEALFIGARSEGGFTDFPDLTVNWLKAHCLR